MIGVDKDARRFLPHLGHWADDVVVDGRGSLYATFHLQGVSADLDDALDVMRRWLQDNKLVQGINDARVELWDHFTRMRGLPMRCLPPVDNWLGAQMDDTYRTLPANAGLSENDLWVTVVFHRNSGVAAVARNLVTSPRRFVAVPRPFLRDFRDVVQAVSEGLARYGARRLGLRVDAGTGQRFSEIFEAWHVIANNTWQPIGLSAEPMGRLIVPSAPVFGDARSRELKLPRADGASYCAVLTFLRFPEATRPLMLDELRGLDCGLTFTSVLAPESRLRALNRLKRTMNLQDAGGDPAVAKAVSMTGDRNAIAMGRSIPVVSHFSIAVHAPTLEDLDHMTARVMNILAQRAGVIAHRQGRSIKAAFYAQVPGNLRWSPSKGHVKSLDAVALGARHNVPRGAPEGRWGSPLLMLRTLQGTEVGFHLHVTGSPEFQAEDLGNTKIIGPPGSGKTALAGMLCGVGGQRIPRCRTVIIDNQLGLSVATEALGGAYLEFEPGTPCLALLPSLSNTPADARHAKQVLLGCITSDGTGGVDSLEDARLTRGIARQLTMPPHLRSIAGVHAFLPNRRRMDGIDSAANRLHPWCRGQERGWVLDAERDPLDLSGRVMGFDTTKLLRDPRVCAPVMTNLLYRISHLIDGDPLILLIDEGWQIALIPELEIEVLRALATIRKHEGVVVLAAQMAETFHTPTLSGAFRNQIPTSIYFGNSRAPHDIYVGREGLTEAEYEVVTEVLPTLPRAFLLKRPGFSAICRFDLAGAPGVVSILSARGSTYRLMRSLQRKHGRRPEQWVPSFMHQAPAYAADPLLQVVDEIPVPLLEHAL